VTTSSKRTLGAALAVSLGGFLFGFDASVISGVIRFIKPQFGLSDLELGWVVSSPAFSAMFAMLAAGALADRWGRKRVLIWVAFLYAVSAILSALAPSAVVLVVARMLGGIAFGAALILAPMYIAEISPAERRGRLVSVQQLNIVLGFSAAYFSNYYVLKAIGSVDWLTDETAWRWMLGVEAVPALLYVAAASFIPSSPRWLMMVGREQEASRVLSWLHGEVRAAEEAVAIQEQLASQSQAPSEYRMLLSRGLRYVLGVGLLVGVLQ
jgi:SP family arabinose:H+ symporter-like MFS transporter